MARRRDPEPSGIWTLDDDEERIDIRFEPVPSLTGRRDGWTAARQQAFIQALCRGASAAAAARQVGKSVRSAYRLCDREGGIDFARAWDEAADIGRARTIDNVIDRAQHGSWVPIVRRGRIVRMEYRYFDRLALALLGDRDRPDDFHRRQMRAEHRRDVRALDRQREERAKAERLMREANDARREIWGGARQDLRARMKARRTGRGPRIVPL